MDVPEERKFVGFDAYKKAMDCLKPGDVAIFATPPAFRWVHFTYAIEKGLNVFMEKPVTVDGPSTRRMLALGEESVEEEPQGRRGPDGRGIAAAGSELFDRIKSGEIGDIIALRAYRMHGAGGCFARAEARRTSANCSTRSSGSTASSGPAAASTATSTFTRSTNARG